MTNLFSSQPAHPPLKKTTARTVKTRAQLATPREQRAAHQQSKPWKLHQQAYHQIKQDLNYLLAHPIKAALIPQHGRRNKNPAFRLFKQLYQLGLLAELNKLQQRYFSGTINNKALYQQRLQQVMAHLLLLFDGLNELARLSFEKKHAAWLTLLSHTYHADDDHPPQLASNKKNPLNKYLQFHRLNKNQKQTVRRLRQEKEKKAADLTLLTQCLNTKRLAKDIANNPALKAQIEQRYQLRCAHLLQPSLSNRQLKPLKKNLVALAEQHALIKALQKKPDFNHEANLPGQKYQLTAPQFNSTPLQKTRTRRRKKALFKQMALLTTALIGVGQALLVAMGVATVLGLTLPLALLLIGLPTFLVNYALLKDDTVETFRQVALKKTCVIQTTDTATGPQPNKQKKRQPTANKATTQTTRLRRIYLNQHAQPTSRAVFVNKDVGVPRRRGRRILLCHAVLMMREGPSISPIRRRYQTTLSCIC